MKEYPKPSLTADILIMSQTKNKILLIKRGRDPYKDFYAFPGGFSNPDETIYDTAKRELFEETNVEGLKLKLLDVFSRPGRDPRGWTVSAAFTSFVNVGNIKVKAGDDAKDYAWFDIVVDKNVITLTKCIKGNDTLTNNQIIKYTYHIQEDKVLIAYQSEVKLAFDHAEILTKAIINS